MTPISCYIRTLNETRMVADVIAAALEVADEVVVVDSGSTDGTVEVAEKAGARVIHQDWLGNGFQKRVGEEACRHDWLLDLDADEIVSDRLAAEIRALFAEGAPEEGVCRLKLAIAPPVGDPWEDFGYSWRAKLYDRRRFRMPGHAAWDQLTDAQQKGARTLDGPLLHYAFEGIWQQVAKVNHGSTVRAKELPLRPVPVLAARIVLTLPLLFLKRYLLHGMFRGGVYGFAVAATLAFGKWLRDVKMYERAIRARNAGRGADGPEK